MRAVRKTAFVAALFLCLGAPNRAVAMADTLVPLVEGLHWPHVSSLIGYAGRVWFVNSRKYLNHNSADIWSYDPATGKARYERHLFSQDAGDPVVHDGLLYWPFEDSRFSAGRGEFMVTNGRDWRWGLIPDGRAFHVHAMASSGGALYAAPSAWVARLQSSNDGGTNWKLLYEHPTPERRVSRITALADLNGTLYGGLVAWYRSNGAKLLRWTGNTFEQVSGWPEGSAVPRLITFKDWLYGVNIGSERSSLWRTNGRIVEPATRIFDRSIRAMAIDEDAMWIAAEQGDDGQLWRSPDGLRWSLYQKFRGVKLHGVYVLDGQVFAGGSGKDGGVLFGPPKPGTPVSEIGLTGEDRPPKPLPRARPEPGEDPQAALSALTTSLMDTSGYDRDLRLRFAPLALSDDPGIGGALGGLLTRDFPDAQGTMFGGRKFPASQMARWYILWAMAHNGHGRVPAELIAAPWEAAQNDAEKYFESPPAAAWAAAQLGQDDPETIGALIARLDRDGDPDWLKGDMIGALTVLTGQRFAYDIPAWKRWWELKKKP